MGLPLVGFGFGEGKEGNGVAGAVGSDRKSAVRSFVRDITFVLAIPRRKERKIWARKKEKCTENKT